MNTNHNGRSPRIVWVLWHIRNGNLLGIFTNDEKMHKAAEAYCQEYYKEYRVEEQQNEVLFISQHTTSRLIAERWQLDVPLIDQRWKLP